MPMIEMDRRLILPLTAIFMMARSTTDDGTSSESSERSVPERAEMARGPFREERLASDVDDQVMFDELAYVVMIFEFNAEDQVIPLCFGILITAADVLTACSCVQNVDDTSYLQVKPKSSIVDWDDNYRMVIQILVHPHCAACDMTSYNNVAILTVEAMIIMQGLAEEFPKTLIVSDEGLKWREMYRDCFILGLSTGFKTPVLGTLEVRKHNFTVWKTGSANNSLGTVVIFGSSVVKIDSILHETRFPASPLMCRRKTGPVPIGIYLGVFCPKWFGPVTPDFVNNNCANTTLKNCEDCVPVNLKPEPRLFVCLNASHYEMVLKLSALFPWIDDNVFAPFKIKDYFRFRISRSSIISRLSSEILISTVFLIIAF